MFKDTDLFDYLSDELSAEKRAQVEKWIESSEENRRHFYELEEFFKIHQDKNSEKFLEEDWAKLEAQIKNSAAGNKNRIRSVAWWLSRAAAVIIIALGTYLIFDLQNKDIVVRGKTAEPVATILPDGSEVYLSKGSRLYYTNEFNQNNREVKILGEAYFAVTTDREKPFIVDTGEAKIKVTGTSFLVSARESTDNVEVAVNSGKVLFYNSETFSENSFKVDLGPGDIGIYSHRLNQLNKTHDKEHKNSIWKQEES